MCHGHGLCWQTIRVENFKNLVTKYKFNLINDNCHALGAKFYGKSAYAAKYADFVIQSFHMLKILLQAKGY